MSWSKGTPTIVRDTSVRHALCSQQHPRPARGGARTSRCSRSPRPPTDRSQRGMRRAAPQKHWPGRARHHRAPGPKGRDALPYPQHPGFAEPAGPGATPPSPLRSAPPLLQHQRLHHLPGPGRVRPARDLSGLRPAAHAPGPGRRGVRSPSPLTRGCPAATPATTLADDAATRSFDRWIGTSGSVPCAHRANRIVSALDLALRGG